MVLTKERWQKIPHNNIHHIWTKEIHTALPHILKVKELVVLPPQLSHDDSSSSKVIPKINTQLTCATSRQLVYGQIVVLWIYLLFHQ